MRPQPTQVIASTLGATSRATTRRGLLSAAAKTAGAGALALVAAGLPTVGNPSLTGASAEFADDRDVLRYVLGLEHLEYALYRDALWRFSVDEANEDRPIPRYPTLQRIRDQERHHVGLLTAALAERGGEVPAVAEYDFGYDDFAGFLAVAAEAQTAVVAAYAGALPATAEPALVALLAGLLGVEARHAAYLNGRIGESPFPAVSDAASTRAETLAFAERYIVR